MQYKNLFIKLKPGFIMRFGHIADCHIGGWREPKLKELTIKTFNEAVNICIKKHVAFLLISGDLFNTSVPGIELISEVAAILGKLKEKDIEVYIVPGSHDFSPSGKTMLDVLEKAGLLKNVFLIENNKLKFTIDKTNTKITGLLGLRNNLEKSFYENLDYLDNEEGFKIFLFHTTINEIKPAGMEKAEGQSINLLPKSFNYYAGGHVHYVKEIDFGKGKLVYPGPLFPNNFKELEELGKGSFYIVDDKLNLEKIEINLVETKNYFFDANFKTANEIENEIIETIKDYENKILIIRIEGRLKTGKPSDLNFNRINEYFKDAYCVLINANKLNAEVFGENTEKSISEIEEDVVKKFENSEGIDEILKSLDYEKSDDEKAGDFEQRLFKNFIKNMRLGEIFKDDY